MIPVFLLIAVVTFDLARIYLNILYAQEIAALVAKLARSEQPAGYPLPEDAMGQLVRYPSGEDPEVTAKRTGFYTSDGERNALWGSSEHGYTDKERAVLNLAWGFAATLSPRMYFPIPEPLNELDPVRDLGNRVNCSIYFRYARGEVEGGDQSILHDPVAIALPAETAPEFEAAVSQSRDRIFFVKCAVPLTGLRILNLFADREYITITRSAYAYESGSLCLSSMSALPACQQEAL